MEAMEMRVFSVLLLLCVGGFRETLAQQALTFSLKYNVTRYVGTNIVLECVSDSMPSSTNQQPPSWYKYDPQKVLIYDSTTGEVDANKYSIGSGNNNTLTVMNVQLSEALTYCCNRGGLRDYCCNVVVIGSLTPSVYPTDGLKVGDAINLTCSLSYNAPTTDVDAPLPLSPEQDPKLSMFIGQTDVTDGVQGEQVVGTDSVPHSKTLSFNRTITKEDAGQNLTCKVSSGSPRLENQTTTSLNVRVATKTAWIIYPNGSRNSEMVYPLYSEFTCAGDGYPAPTCEWLDGRNQSVENKRSQGRVSWTATQEDTFDRICSAKYDPTGNITYNVTRIRVGNAVNTSAVKNTDNKVALGVGLGIGLGVPILLGLIILIVILARRKKKASDPYPVKQPEAKSKSPATGKSPNGKNNDPSAGPRNNVNPNPNPTYTTPVMPEQTGNSGQRNVRDSPGYGDLGVRHIGGSGSNPHLNESFDSKADASFESSRNQSAGGNIAFKPGRSGQSPPAPNTSV